MARSTRSSGGKMASKAKASKTTTVAAASKKKASSSPAIASVSETKASTTTKKAPSSRRRGGTSSSVKKPATTNKGSGSAKKQSSTGKKTGTTTKASNPSSLIIKPTSRRPPVLPTSTTSTASLSFPPPRRFLVGTALSVYQNSGGSDTNWSVFEKKRAWGGLRPAILGDTPCGQSSGFWDRHFDADAELARSVGSNCMRLSLEWSRIIPKPGVVDAAAIQRYREIFDSLEKRGMEVLITLHHFVHPSWFDETCGGFESDEGLRHFVEWSKVAFAAFGDRIASWCTFNEPGVFASSGYCTGFFPPGKVLRLQTAGDVLLRMLRSHTAAVGEMRRMSAAMHGGVGGGSGGGGSGRSLKANAKKSAGGGVGGARKTSSTAAPKSSAPSQIPRHSFGIVHNVMPYEAKPCFGVSPGLDLAEDAASVEQGFHSGMTVQAELEFEELQRKHNRNRRRNSSTSTSTPPLLPTSPVPAPPPSRDPSRGWSPPWSRAAAALGHAQWGNDVVLRYFSTGVFEWDPLGGCLPPPLMRAARLFLGDRRIARLDRIKEPHPPPLDWFGLNFYGRVVLDWKLAPTCYSGEIMSDFGQGVWPSGFKAAIRRASRELKVPVIVTETGIPDGTDAIRGEWADSYLGALEEVLQEEEEEEKAGKGGKKQKSSSSSPSAAVVDLRGVCYWSLIDSFEWAFGYSWFTKFGLFDWDFKTGPDGERKRRSSAGRVQRWFGRLAGVAEKSWRRRGLEFEPSFPSAKKEKATTKKRPATAAAAAAVAAAGRRR